MSKFGFALLALVLPLMGCNELSSPGSSGGGGSEDGDAALGAKLGEYIKCMNGPSTEAMKSRHYYLSYFDDAQAGPTGKESSLYGPLELHTDYCFAGLAKAATMDPKLPEVDAAGAAYKVALTELEPVVKEAHKYYDQKDYKDDGVAKGKAMHPKLMAAFAKFEQAANALADKVTALNDAVNERELESLGKDPARRLAYLSQRSLRDAKKVVDLADIAELKELDQAKFEAALQGYDRAFTELETYVDGHKEEAGKVTLFSQYMSLNQAFLKAAKELMRRKRDGKDFNAERMASSHPAYVDGHPAQVIEKYNAMVDRSNTLSF